MKPSIPHPAPGDTGPNTRRVLLALKERSERMAGEGSPIQPLPPTATLAEVITAFNALLAQVSG